MPIFEIEKDGKSFEVDAPDMMTAAKAFNGYAPPSTSEDVMKSGASGVASGATKLAGLIPDIASMTKGAANKYLFDPLLNATLGPPKSTKSLSDLVTGGEGAQPPDINKIFGSANIQKTVEGLTGDFYQPKTTAGKYAHSIGEAVPGSVAAPGGMAARLLSAIGAGTGSEALGQATEGTGWEPYARVGGALAGGMAPYVAGRAITPIPSNPQRERLVQVLNDEGVNSLTAGQRTGNKTLQYLESASSTAPGGGGGATRVQEEGQRQFTQAAMRRAGAGAEATPEALAANNQRLGNAFEDLSARNNLVPDNQMINDITAAVTRYRRVPESQQARMLQGYIDDIVPHINAGTMPGVEYRCCPRIQRSSGKRTLTCRVHWLASEMRLITQWAGQSAPPIVRHGRRRGVNTVLRRSLKKPLHVLVRLRQRARSSRPICVIPWRLKTAAPTRAVKARSPSCPAQDLPSCRRFRTPERRSERTLSTFSIRPLWALCRRSRGEHSIPDPYSHGWATSYSRKVFGMILLDVEPFSRPLRKHLGTSSLRQFRSE